MFPEYRDKIAKLRQEDNHFARLFDEHNVIDHKIQRLANNNLTANLPEVNTLKIEKLRLKELLYSILKKIEDC